MVEMLGRRSQPISVSAAAVSLGLPKSSCHRLLTLLVAKGYVERVEGKLYRLVRPVGLGGLTPFQSKLAGIAEPILAAAALRSGVSSFLTVLLGSGCLRYIVKKLPAGQEMVYDRDISRDREPSLVASGKCLLAYGSAADTKEAEAIRAAGLVVNLEGVMEGASGVAAPIFSVSGECLAAVNLAGPRSRFSGRSLDTIIAECRTTADAITAHLAESAEGAAS
nr:IclR family transcriptional regulator C-terminal domain-containing protein [Jiella sonneratiae]